MFGLAALLSLTGYAGRTQQLIRTTAILPVAAGLEHAGGGYYTRNFKTDGLLKTVKLLMAVRVGFEPTTTSNYL